MIKVIIAEDHAVVRRGLSQIIRERDHMTLVKEAVDGTCRAQDDARNRLGYFLLDITLPLRNGLEVLHESRRVYPHRPVLILSAYPEKKFGCRVLR